MTASDAVPAREGPHHTPPHYTASAPPLPDGTNTVFHECAICPTNQARAMGSQSSRSQRTKGEGYDSPHELTEMTWQGRAHNPQSLSAPVGPLSDEDVFTWGQESTQTLPEIILRGPVKGAYICSMQDLRCTLKFWLHVLAVSTPCGNTKKLFPGHIA